MSGRQERMERWAQRTRKRLREQYEAFGEDQPAQTVWLAEKAAELETEPIHLLQWLYSSGRIMTPPPKNGGKR